MLVLFAPGLCGQAATVQDLYLDDWQARNRAAARLCEAEAIDEAALVSAMVREDVPRLPDVDYLGLMGGMGGSRSALRQLIERHCQSIPRRPYWRSLPVPLAESDLVVPFDTRVLAAFVVSRRALRSKDVVEALVAGTQSPDEALRQAMATYLWRTGGAGVASRIQSLQRIERAPVLACTAENGGELARSELVAALRSADPAVRFEILQWLDPAVVRSSDPLVEHVLDTMGADDERCADAAARLAVESVDCKHPEFAECLAHPASSARAAAVLLHLAERSYPRVVPPTSLAPALLRLLGEETTESALAVRVVLVLRAMAATLEKEEVETARAVAAELERRFAEPTLRGDLGLAVVAALGAYAGTRSEACDDRLRRLSVQWMTRISDGKAAALVALAASRRTDLWTDEELFDLYRANPRGEVGDLLAPRLVARGPAGLAVLRAVLAGPTPPVLAHENLGELEPILRTWLADADLRVREGAFVALVRRDADLGLSESELLELVRGMQNDNARSFGRIRLVKTAKDQATWDWLAQNWGEQWLGTDTMRAWIAAPIPRERRLDLLCEFLARGTAATWPTEDVDVAFVRELARRWVAEGAGEGRDASSAWSALAAVGPADARDEELLRAGLRGPHAAWVLLGFQQQKRIPAALLADVAALVDDEEHSGRASQACTTLWESRVR